MLNLFAKAVTDVRGHVVITNRGRHKYRTKSVIRNHYMKSRHMDEFKEGFNSKTGHYILRNKMGLALHWIEETSEIDKIIKTYVDILKCQYNRSISTQQTNEYLYVSVMPKAR